MSEEPNTNPNNLPIPEGGQPAPQDLGVQHGPNFPTPKEYNEVYQRARRDGMTGLLNYEAFKSDVNRRIQAAERGEARPALIYMDFDDFKDLNDTLGHEAANDIIKTLAATLRHNETNTPDFGGRLGGDEFGFLVDLLPRAESQQTDEERLATVVERIRTGLQGTTARVSVGSAIWQRGMSTQDMMDAADQSLYEAKETKESPQNGTLPNAVGSAT